VTLGLVAVAVGATFGAWLRWALGVLLNARSETWPLGTLAANLLGGFLVGIAIAFFAARPGIDVAWRLFVITGFLGGLTTFSSFSAEVVSLLASGEYVAGMLLCGAHLAGSLVLTALGIAAFRAIAA